MLLLLMIYIGWTCSIKNQHLQYLYPTEQEVYKLDMSQLFDGEDLLYICTIGTENSIKDRNIRKCNIKDDGIEMKNVLTEETYSPKFDKLQTINSVSGYSNYISTIGNNNQQLTIYEVNYTNNTITQLFSSQIQVNFNCTSYSSTFISSNIVITDCYNNNNFQLLLFTQDAPPIVIYEQTLFNTNLITYSNLVYINNYIIYAIYLSNQDSYLHTYYYNETTQNALLNSTFSQSTFTDFSLMTDGKSIAILNLTNCIFISSIDNLNNYNQINLIHILNNRQNLALKSFPSYQYGQLITSFIIVNDNYYENIFELQYNGSNFTIIQVYESLQQFTFNYSYPVKIYISTSFLVIQQEEYQSYFYIGKYTNFHEYQAISQIYQNRDFDESVQLYLNYDNKLLKFSRILSWYHLSKPKLIINITNQNQSGQINIFAYENPEVHDDDIDIIGCNLTLSYEQLTQSNNSILNTTNISKLATIQDLQEIFRLNDHFTGPLMQLSLINQLNDSNINMSIPQSEVFKYINDNLTYLWQNYTQIFFIEKYELLFYAWTLTNNFTNIFYTICSIGEKILNCQNQTSIQCNVPQLTTIQMTQLNQTELILVFNQGTQNILIYSISFEIQTNKNYSFDIKNIDPILLQNYTIDNQSSIQQFQILYNKLIILNNQSEIIVYFYNLNTSYSINQITINQIEGQKYDIVFQPIQIQVNQQLYQSTLFINNQNSFIILQLFDTPTKQNNNFTIVSEKQTTQDIYQIVVVQMFIVLASITDPSSNIVSFSVYDISDIAHPSYFKPLPNCTIQLGSQIIADNFFFYVRQLNNNVFVYSVDLPYHSSLYFNLTLNQYQSISCTNTNQLSILSFKNNIYAGLQNNPYGFSIYQVKQQYIMISYTNFSINISNIWDYKNITYELLVVNIYLQISMNITQFNSTNNNAKALTFYVKKNSNDQILIPLNMINVSVGQVMNYSIVATKSGQIQNNLKFNITNQFINEENLFTKQIVNITQMVSFCNSLFYQNTKGLNQSSYVIFDGLQLINYSTYNFTECLSLSVTINGPQIFMNSICKSNKTLTVFQLFPNAPTIKNSTCNSSQPWNILHNISYIYDPPYDSIIKSSQLSNYLFILGKLGQNDNSQQIYIYNIDDLNKSSSSNDSNKQNFSKTVRRIQCRGGISDYNFTILQNKSLINSTWSGRGVIFYLCKNPNELKFVSFNITNTTNLTFSKDSSRVSDVITQYVNRSDARFLQIFIYLVKYDQIILVLTSNNVYNLVIIMSYSPLSYAQKSLQFEDVIAYIPPYGNYNQVPLGVLQNSFLALLFRQPISQGGQYIIAMYDMQKIRNTYNISNQLNYSSTIQMEGGYQFNQSFVNILQIALINQSRNDSGQFLLVLSNNGTHLNYTNVTLLVYNSSIYFNCSDVNDLSDKYQYHLVGSNSFYNTNITIKITPSKLSNSYWAWILLILTIIGCATLVILFWKKIKMQNLEQNKSTELLEIEM